MKLVDKISLIGIALFVYIFFVKPFIINKILLYRNFAYTSCKVVAKEAPAEGMPNFIFRYYIKGKMYKTFLSADTRHQTQIGNCYLLQYYPPDPDICHIDLDAPVKCE